MLLKQHGLKGNTSGEKSTSLSIFPLKFCFWQNFTIVGNSGIKRGTSPAVRLRFHAAWKNPSLGTMPMCVHRCMPILLLEGWRWKNGRLRAVIFSADRTPIKIFRHTSFFYTPFIYLHQWRIYTIKQWTLLYNSFITRFF